MTAYLAAVEADEKEQQAKLAAHAQAMRNRIQELGRKQYWDQFERAPEMVIMFVPSEACLSAAFEQDPALLEFGMGKHVLITTPLTPPPLPCLPYYEPLPTAGNSSRSPRTYVRSPNRGRSFTNA